VSQESVDLSRRIGGRHVDCGYVDQSSSKLRKML
jgi:hypothetical protein